jgi:hypothetical protein
LKTKTKRKEGRPPPPKVSLDLPTVQTADFFSVTVKTVCEWVKAGCPKLGPGLFNLKAVYDWRQLKIEVSEDSPKLVDLKADEIRERTKRYRINNETALGNLMAKEEVKSIWAERIGEARQALLSLHNRVPEECRDQVKGIVRQVLEALSRPGKHCPKARSRK